MAAYSKAVEAPLSVDNSLRAFELLEELILTHLVAEYQNFVDFYHLPRRLLERSFAVSLAHLAALLDPPALLLAVDPLDHPVDHSDPLALDSLGIADPDLLPGSPTA